MLYIVATPIGNLEDISERACRVLKGVDKIAAEDTRHSKFLLKHLKIDTPLIALHEHNEKTQSAKLIKLMQQGESIAIISDAGTPLISDPGFRIVKLAHENNIRVIPIPGACAAIAAISASGLPTNSFIFEGFLPVKSNARKTHLVELKDETRTIIFYEAPHRILPTINDLVEVFGPTRNGVFARELTKTYETIQYGDLNYLQNFITNDQNQQKGEMVIVVEGLKKERNSNEISKNSSSILKTLIEELPLKQAVNLTSKITGDNKKELYNFGLLLKGNK